MSRPPKIKITLAEIWELLDKNNPDAKNIIKKAPDDKSKQKTIYPNDKLWEVFKFICYLNGCGLNDEFEEAITVHINNMLEKGLLPKVRDDGVAVVKTK